MVNLKFHSSLEKLPEHGQSIAYIELASGGFDSEDLLLKETTVEHMWEEIDPSDGYPTGTTVVYDPKNPEPYDDADHLRKRILLGETTPKKYLWLPTEELFNQFDAIFPDDI